MVMLEPTEMKKLLQIYLSPTAGEQTLHHEHRNTNDQSSVISNLARHILYIISKMRYYR